MTAYIVVIVAGVASYMFRVSMLVVAARRPLPAMLDRAGRFAVPAAFAALAAASLATGVADTPALAPILAVAAGAFAVRRTGSPHAAVLAGMPVLWVLTAVAAR
jgi:branched-subunit amino acid transport protein